MDPLSQAVLGASLSQSSVKDKTKLVSALVIGALAGMAPDLDVLIRSTEDPLLFLEFHRQFTHSLIFIPFGALLCSFVFYQFAKSKLSFLQVYTFSLLGYATHGLLDACTSYGTQLFWPFSNERVAWNVVSIIDPLFTIPILILILIALVKKNVLYARFSFVYAVIFLSLGALQYQRAENAVNMLAQQRGHHIERVHIKPSFGNRHLWKLIYEHNGYYYVDAVKLLWDTEYITGSSIQKLDIKRDYPWLNSDSQQAKDVERFRWFSDDFLAVSTVDYNLITDVRYSFLPNVIKPMWAVEVNQYAIDDENLNAHVFFETSNSLDVETRQKFLDMLF